MGYRSQVVLAIKKETFKEKATKKLKESFKDCDKITETETAYIFYWDSVKWYTDFEEVRLVEKFIADNDEDSGYVRIGEEDNDIESVGSAYDFGIQSVTTIEVTEKEDTLSIEDLLAPNAVKFIENINKPAKKAKKKS